jgi:hypothetical protein
MAVTPTYTVPEDYKSGLKDVLAEAKNIYETQKGLGYQTYGGPRIAGFSPDEQAAMQGIAGLVGTGQQYFNPAAALTLGQTQRFDPATAAQYMSPYQQAVVDVEKREAVRQAQVPMQQIRQQAAGAGGYGGSRQAILEAENIRNLQNRLGDIQTKGSQAAYETGLRSFEAQKERERAAASGLSALGQAVPRQALTELTALSGIGEAQRGMTQTGLDIAYQEAEAQKQFPYQALGQYQSTLYGYPYQSYGQFQPTAQPSSSQNLAGILGAVGKVGSSFGFFNSGGRVAYQSGGGLSGMIQKLAAGMGVGSEDTSPLAQAEEKEDYLVNVIKALQGQTKAQEEYGSISKEVMAEQQRAAKERQEQLQKASSPINYISDLLIGYAAADPEAGLGAQLGGAATYAEEQKKTVQDEITKIQTELLEGQISQAEADVKLAQLGVESASDLYTLYGSAKNYLPDRSNLSTFGKDIMGIAADSEAGGRQLAKAVEETMTEAQSIIDDDPSAYRNKADQQALAYKILRKKLMPESEGDVNVETPNAAGNRSVDGKTSIPSPTAKADELLKM